MGSERKSKEEEEEEKKKKKKKKRISYDSEDEGKGKRRTTEKHNLDEGAKSNTENKHKSNKKHKSHQSSSKHQEKKSKDKQKKSKHDRHDDQSNLKFQVLSTDDYFSKNNEFATWLKEEKNMFFSDLSSEAARELFAHFVKDWNNRKLESRYYEGIDTGPRTAHKWKIKQ